MKKELQILMKEANLPEKDKLTIKFLIESIETGNVSEFNDKTFLFGGDPGIGKTHFVENLLNNLSLPVLFIGPFKYERENVKQFKNLQDLKKELIETEECIVFIDDLQNTIDLERDGMGDVHLSDSESKSFINILEHIKRSKGRKYLFMTLNDDSLLEESWADRIETRIDLEEPKEKSKKLYLENKYLKHLSKKLINEISVRTFGYNFRDLDELIRRAYRISNGKINRNGIIQAFSEYTPTSLEGYNIIHKPGIKFKDIVGNEKLKKELAYLKDYIENPSFFSKRGIERSNVLMFAGPPGTGKTFMAKALAGELDVPLINIDGRVLLGRGGPSMGINRLVHLSRKFRNCIVFVDEIDKFIGGQMLAEDNEIIGHLEAELDGVKSKMQSIVILTMNNKIRFGSAFHDRIPCFTFGYPEESERRGFIIKKSEKSKIALSEEQTNRLVRETKDKSYRQLEKIWNNIMFKLVENSGHNIKRNKVIFSAEHLEEAIDEILGFTKTVRYTVGIG